MTAWVAASGRDDRAGTLAGVAPRETPSALTVIEAGPDDWSRVRTLRVASLRINPEAFGARVEDEILVDERQWRERVGRCTYLIASDGDTDVAIMSVECLDGDYGATCWIGGCWTDPEHRGRGAVRALIDFMDGHAEHRGWTVQGLGVWTHNEHAIARYDSLGFRVVGGVQASTSHPGWTYQRMLRRAGVDGCVTPDSSS